MNVGEAEPDARTHSVRVSLCVCSSSNVDLDPDGKAWGQNMHTQWERKTMGYLSTRTGLGIDAVAV
jgi:hypothetical protein